MRGCFALNLPQYFTAVPVGVDILCMFKGLPGELLAVSAPVLTSSNTCTIMDVPISVCGMAVQVNMYVHT